MHHCRRGPKVGHCRALLQHVRKRFLQEVDPGRGGAVIPPLSPLEPSLPERHAFGLLDLRRVLHPCHDLLQQRAQGPFRASRSLLARLLPDASPREILQDDSGAACGHPLRQ